MNKKISTGLVILAAIVGNTSLSARNISFEQDLMNEKRVASPVKGFRPDQ